MARMFPEDREKYIQKYKDAMNLFQNNEPYSQNYRQMKKELARFLKKG